MRDGNRYNPVFFNRGGDADFIPSIPWGTEVNTDPNKRDLQASLGRPDPVAEWVGRKSRWTFSRENGELESPSYLMTLDRRYLSGVLDEAWEKFGRANVKKLILNLSPSCATENYSVLMHKGFTRDESREKGGPDSVPNVVWTGPVTRWSR